MFDNKKQTIILCCFLANLCLVLAQSPVVESDIIFQFYKKNFLNGSTEMVTSNSFNDNLVEISGCDPNGKLAIMVHGWNDTCRNQWAVSMIQNLFDNRGGCIVCMNYEAYSNNSNFFQLVAQFSAISNVLTKKLNQFRSELFNPDKMYMFGFSFGAQLVINSGRDFGTHLIPHIDACEPAGPGFDSNATYAALDPTLAAQLVQCIHTSTDVGTSLRNCNFDWLMGNCGITQNAAGSPPLGSHGLCPYIFDSAYTFPFPASSRPNIAGCVASDREPSYLPLLNMGYLDAELLINKEIFFLNGWPTTQPTINNYFYNLNVRETLYSNTSATPPYNIFP